MKEVRDGKREVWRRRGRNSKKDKKRREGVVRIKTWFCNN